MHTNIISLDNPLHQLKLNCNVHYTLRCLYGATGKYAMPMIPNEDETSCIYSSLSMALQFHFPTLHTKSTKHGHMQRCRSHTPGCMNNRTIHLIRQTMHLIHTGNLTFMNGIHPVQKKVIFYRYVSNFYVGMVVG